jgi:hypothetical protein
LSPLAFLVIVIQRGVKLISPCDLKLHFQAGCWRLTAIQEAEIRRTAVQFKASPGKYFVRPYLKNTQHKTGLVE